MKRAVAAVGLLVGTAAPCVAGIEDGAAAYVRGDFETARREYLPLARAGDAAAQFGLGLLHHLGRGVPRNPAEAARLYRLAARQGDFRAQYYLGDMYRRGHGVPQDYTEAAFWYHDAAVQGYADAQHALGLMFRGGLGVPRDDEEAVLWFTKAAEQDLVRAQVFLGHLRDIGQGVTRDRIAAARWYARAARQGDLVAQMRLAKMYYHGDGIAKDRGAAAVWYRRAADQGDAHAAFMLGVMAHEGKGLVQSDVEAYMWFELAADRATPPKIRNMTLRNRDIVAFGLSPAEIAEARWLGQLWRSVPPAATPPEPRRTASRDYADVRERVSRVQRGLAAIGFGHGAPDGYLGPRTRAAIKAFQLIAGLPATGRIDDRLEAALQTAPLPSRDHAGRRGDS